MQIAQVLSGYSLGRADLLRRAMGKKKKEIMDAEKAGFMEGAKGLGVDVKIADSVFELIAFFAGYGFNRSHSAAYGWITYQTAYLKHHYPHEFMAGLMSCDADNIDNVVKFIAEARAMGLTALRPDVNESEMDFTVRPRLTEAEGEAEAHSNGANGNTGKKKKAKGREANRAAREGATPERNLDHKVIRFGMGAVKGVGAGAVEAILEARKEGGELLSLYDLCRRVDNQRCNRRVLEQLVKSGALDGIGGAHHRAELFGALETAMERGATDQRDRRSGQTSLFGLIEAPAAKTAAPMGGLGEPYPQLEPWSHKQLLAFEKEALGFYISGHPLDRYRSDLARYANATTSDFAAERRGPGDAAIGGVVSQYREMITKKGDKMARFILEDAEGSIEVVAFPKTFERVRHVLVSDEPILCAGTVKNEGTAEAADWKMLLESAQALAELRHAKTSQVDIHLNADSVTPDQIEALRTILEAAPGSCAAIVRLRVGQRAEAVIPLGSTWQVAPTDELLARLERVFGDRVATLA